MLTESAPAHLPAIAALRDEHRSAKQALLDELRSCGASTRGIQRLLRQLARRTDDTLRRLWQLLDMPAGMALVAVGGYGRGELFPHSDVDVLLLLPDSRQSDARLIYTGLTRARQRAVLITPPVAESGSAP